MSADVIPEGSGTFDHRSFDLCWNWRKATTPLAREKRGEQGEAANGTKWSSDGLPANMCAAEHDGVHGEQEREGEGESGVVR